MIVPLKIVVCSLKSVKQLPYVRNNSPVMSTPWYLDSPVVNTPVSWILGVFGTSLRTGLLSGSKQTREKMPL
jgi:hypothetical protein